MIKQGKERRTKFILGLSFKASVQLALTASSQRHREVGPVLMHDEENYIYQYVSLGNSPFHKFDYVHKKNPTAVVILHSSWT